MKDVAQKYLQIIKEIENYQNGVIASGLQNLGLGYKFNYGLSVTQIDTIASTLAHNNELALYCWRQESRESKLISFRLLDPELITLDEINEILAGISNLELAEQAASRFFIQLSDNLTLVSKLLNSGNEFVIHLGLLTVLKALKIKKETDIELCNLFIDLLKTIRWPDKIYIKRALSEVLIKIVIGNIKFEKEVLNWIEDYKSINQYFSEQLKTEIIYFLQTKN